MAHLVHEQELASGRHKAQQIAIRAPFCIRKASRQRTYLCVAHLSRYKRPSLMVHLISLQLWASAAQMLTAAQQGRLHKHLLDVGPLVLAEVYAKQGSIVQVGKDGVQLRIESQAGNGAVSVWRAMLCQVHCPQHLHGRKHFCP